MELNQRYIECIAKEQIAFRQVIKTYLPNDNSKISRILDICSGIANEEPLLIDYFGKKIELVSLEINKSLEKISKELGRKSVRFGDVRKLDNYIEGKFNLVIGRNIPLNPNYNHCIDEIHDYWPEVFEDLLKFIEFDSTLFLTFAREDEFYRAQEILDNIVYKLKVKEKNPIIVQSDYIGVCGADTKDNYVVIAQSPFQLRLF